MALNTNKIKTQSYSHFSKIKILGVLVFPGFELLDTFGPLEMFGSLPDKFKIVIIAEKKGLIKSDQGPQIFAEEDLQTAPPLDILLIPGGIGTRKEVNNQELMSWIKHKSQITELTLSVCTGAALLAKSGVLDHHLATSNKMALNWVRQQGPQVNWVKKARWVEDGKFITSSGVASGIDMSLYVIGKLYGPNLKKQIADMAEYTSNQNPAFDPFAK